MAVLAGGIDNSIPSSFSQHVEPWRDHSSLCIHIMKFKQKENVNVGETQHILSRPKENMLQIYPHVSGSKVKMTHLIQECDPDWIHMWKWK